jgi:hypothetical protein
MFRDHEVLRERGNQLPFKAGILLRFIARAKRKL